MGGKRTLAFRGKAVPAFGFSGLVPKLHGRKSALSLGNMYGFQVVAGVKIQSVHDAVFKIQE